MKEDTQQRLLEATLKLISEKGYPGATTREIAQEAGVTELTLFRHFGSKEKLFEEVLKSYTFLPALKEMIPELEELPCHEALIRIATKFILTLRKRKSMIKIMHTEIILYPDQIREVYTRFIEDQRSVLAQYFGRLQKKGIFRGISSDTAARMFLSILFSYYRNEELVSGQEITRNKMDKSIQEFVDIFLHGTLNAEQL